MEPVALPGMGWAGETIVGWVSMSLKTRSLAAWQPAECCTSRSGLNRPEKSLRVLDEADEQRRQIQCRRSPVRG